jgi:hypothetical protein
MTMRNFLARLFLVLLCLGYAPAFADEYDSRPPSSSLNIATSTVIKPAAGCLMSVNVTTAGSQGAIYDTAATGTTGAANLIADIPATVGTYYFGTCFPFFAGLVVAPGSSQVVSISFK